jgi:cytochrome c-type biogenesis protein
MSGVVQPSASAEPLWRHRAFRWTLAVAVPAALSASLWWSPVQGTFMKIESDFARVLPEPWVGEVTIFLLPIVAFLSGLLSSISPCVLPLVPLHIAYIGAAEATGWSSVRISLRFVLGAALALSALGLFGDLAGFLLVEQRGPMLVAVGALLVYFGLVSLEVVAIPFGGFSLVGSGKLGPMGAGAAFSLITTPCSSPLLAAVLAAAAAQSVPGLAVATMLCFALGYTFLVFLGGLFGGGLVSWARHGRLVAPRAAAAALLVASGVGFAAAGAAWF